MEGVVVKLYRPGLMSNLSEELEKDTHVKPGHRIWMDQEYRILTPGELLELKRHWDGK